MRLWLLSVACVTGGLVAGHGDIRAAAPPHVPSTGSAKKGNGALNPTTSRMASPASPAPVSSSKTSRPASRPASLPIAEVRSDDLALAARTGETKLSFVTYMNNGDQARAGPARLVIRRRLAGAPLPAVDPARNQALAAVRRLAAAPAIASRDDGTFDLSRVRNLCTATLLVRGASTVAVTAAHCLFEMDASQHLTGRTQPVVIEGLGSAATVTGRAAASFTACAQRPRADGARPTVAGCLAQGAQDVALIDVTVPSGVARWKPCSEAPAPSTHFTVFGYGLNHEALPATLLDGDFTVQQASETNQWRLLGDVISSDGVRQSADGGDSGGPAIAESQDSTLATNPPEVCFVASSVEDSNANDLVLRKALARLQPTWNLDQRMAQALPGSPGGG